MDAVADRGPARALVTEVVVRCLRRHVGRGPDHSRAAFLGERTIVVELGRVLTAAHRAMTMTGRGDLVGAYWTELGLAIGPDLAAEVGRALDVEATCASWVVDADADSLLLVLNLRSAGATVPLARV